MTEAHPSIALNRFGLGAGSGELAAATAAPRAYLLRQLLAPVAPAAVANLPRNAEQGIAMLLETRRVAVTARAALRKAVEGGVMADRPAAEAVARDRVVLIDEELAHCVATAVRTPAPLIERLALYWMDHFTVSGTFVRFLAGAMEREAIRPHLTGRFAGMLRAAVLHPAMLVYLDNRSSIGPNSPAGQQSRGRRGLNENLAREVLELHTLGVDGGYTQQDVVALARVLTGWSVDTSEAPHHDRRIGFFAEQHEPGPKTLLGRRYPQDGAEQAFAVLDDLARHPATARHVSRRIVRHFVGHGLPGLEARVAEVFLRTEGDLGAVTGAMIVDDEAWGPPRKVRAPIELLLAAARLLGDLPPQPRPGRSLTAMGQPFWGTPSPKGWPIEDDAWAAPDSIKTRLDWASELSARVPSGTDARRLMDGAFGAAVSAETRRAVERAADGRQALTLLLLSPEFQRR